ncbi:DUF7351 domain-containing protein [Salinigranum marinum]|uniref:DUF7351 domain-containing protein n=1 Tax=Salinigranum marinum TaxID=1515595 RepID=UPI003CCD4422
MRITRPSTGSSPPRTHVSNSVSYIQQITLEAALVLLDESAVISFYRDHGLDLRATPYWRLDWCVSDDYTTVQSNDPWEIAVSIVHNADTLTVTLNRNLAVTDIKRDTPRSVS